MSLYILHCSLLNSEVGPTCKVNLINYNTDFTAVITKTFRYVIYHATPLVCFTA